MVGTHCAAPGLGAVNRDQTPLGRPCYQPVMVQETVSSCCFFPNPSFTITIIGFTEIHIWAVISSQLIIINSSEAQSHTW